MAQRDDESPEIDLGGPEVEQTEVIPASPVPDDIMQAPASWLWNNIMHGHLVQFLEGEEARIMYPHFHVLRHLLGFKGDRRIMDAWPRSVYWLTVTLIIVLFLTVAAFVGILVCTAIGGNAFSLRMAFTTDSIVAHVYPIAENNVGNPKVGWFFTAAFGWQMVILGILLFFPNAFRRYLVGEIAYRVDTWKALSQFILVPFTFLAVCGSVGITNVFLLTTLVVGIAFIWSIWHYMIDQQFYSIARVFAGVPTTYRHGGEIKIAKNQTLRDASEITITGKYVNTQAGLATAHPLVISKTFSHNMVMGLVSYEAANAGSQDRLRYNWASAMANWLNPTLNIIMPTVLFVFMLIIVPIAYYGMALNNSNNTFQWWVHVPFWFFIVGFILDLAFSVFYWAFINKRIVAHSIEANTTTLELLVSHYIYTGVTWVFWTLLCMFCAFVTLGGGHGHGLWY